MSRPFDKEQADKIAALQRLIDEAEEDGAGVQSMRELLAAARREICET